MPLVIDEDLLTLRIDQQGAVVWRASDVAGRKLFSFPFDDAGKKPMSSANGEARSALGKLIVLPGKGRGRFGPDNQIGTVRGRLQAQFVEFVQVVFVDRKPIRWVRIDFWKIGLHGAREVS